MNVHLRAAGEVDVPNLPPQREERKQPDDRRDDGDADPNPLLAHEVDAGHADDPQHLQLFEEVHLLGHVEQHPRAEGRGEHVQNDAQPQGHGETFYLIGADHVQHGGGDQRRDVRIDDRVQGAVEAVANRHFERGAAGQLFPHTLVNQHVRIDRHADGQGQGRQAGKRKLGLDEDHHGHDQQHVQGGGQSGHDAREPIVENHEGRHGGAGQPHRERRRSDRVGPQQRIDVFLGHRLLRQGGGQFARVQNLDERFDFRLGEVSGDLPVGADPAIQIGGGQQSVVEDDAQAVLETDRRVGQVLACQIAEFCGPDVVEAEIDGPAARAAIDSGTGIIEVAAVHLELQRILPHQHFEFSVAQPRNHFLAFFR